MTVNQIILKIEELEKEKLFEIRNKNYERAAKLRDDIRKLIDELEEAMNPSDEEE